MSLHLILPVESPKLIIELRRTTAVCKGFPTDTPIPLRRTNCILLDRIKLILDCLRR